MNKQEFGTPFSATTISIASAVAIVNGTAVGVSVANYVTDVSGSSDVSGTLLTVTNGTVVIWQTRLSANVPYDHTFSEPIGGSFGSAILVTVASNVATFTTANVAGFQLGR